MSERYQPYAYGPVLDDGRTISSLILPPPPTGPIPPPPPPRSSDNNSLNVNQGEISSYFGGNYHQS